MPGNFSLTLEKFEGKICSFTTDKHSISYVSYNM